MTDIISEVARRVRGYWFVDGLAEIGSGAMFMVLSIPYLLWSMVPVGSRMARLASTGRDVLLLLGILILLIVVRVAKQRSTYPRTGYLEERRPGRREVGKVLAIAVGGILLLALTIAGAVLLFPAVRADLIRSMVYLPALLGLGVMLFYIDLRYRTGVRRFSGLAGIALLLSLGLATNSSIDLAMRPIDWDIFASASQKGPMPAEAGVVLEGLFRHVYTDAAIFLAVFGLAMLVSGLVVRREFLRSNPIATEETK